MTVRGRLLLTAMVTLAVGLGSLLVIGNLLLAQRSRAEVSSVLRADAQAQISALIVTPTDISVRETANDDVLDRRSWVFDHGRLVERPAAIRPEVDAIAARLGRARQRAEADAPDDLRLRAERPAPDRREAVGRRCLLRPCDLDPQGR